MLRFDLFVPALPAIVATAMLASCGLFCDEEPDLSCGGSPKRQTPECAKPSGYGCNDSNPWGGLGVDLPPLADGSYRLEGSADGEPFSCPLSIVGQSLDLDSLHAACPAWQIAYESDADLGFAAAPCEVTIELRDGEGVLAGGTFRPHYAWDEPKGEYCGWRALARVALAPIAR